MVQVVTEDMQPLPLEAAQQGINLTLALSGGGRADDILVTPSEGAQAFSLALL